MDKKEAMIIYGGNEIAGLEKSLPDPEMGDVINGLNNMFEDSFIK